MGPAMRVAMRVALRVALVAGGLGAAALLGACSDSDASTEVAASETLEAHDMFWTPDELTVPEGRLEIDIVNEGQAPHTFLVEGREHDLLLEVTPHGDTDRGTIDLDPGTYVFYCDVPGHRAAGMEGVLTVE